MTAYIIGDSLRDSSDDSCKTCDIMRKLTSNLGDICHWLYRGMRSVALSLRSYA